MIGRRPSLASRVATGVVAGSAGTLALNATTYADMLLTGRAASSTPSKMVTTLADAVGVPLAAGDDEAAHRTAAHRAEGAGALLGQLTGVIAGVAFALVRPRVRRLPTVLAGLAAGLAVMAATDSANVAAGTTKLSEWGVRGWLSDLVPHAAFGLVLAAVHDRG
jgi:hypothetical protein